MPVTDPQLTTYTRVLRIRIKDKHAAFLRERARDVNQVWNYDNALQIQVWRREQRFLSGYDFAEYTNGATKAGLALHSQTVQAVSEEYATRRKQAKKTRLRWRVSHGPKRSLGWIPFKKAAISYRNGQLWLAGLDKPLCIWDSYDLSQYELGAGNISEDSRGRWYINITVKRKAQAPQPGKGVIGIDLGLKDFAGFSEDAVPNVEAPKFYRDLEPKLAVAQRANKKARVKAIHAKIANRRKDFLHKLSTQLVREYGAIFVGDVNASKLAKTGMAKSVLDAGWSAFRNMLQYKSDDAGSWVKIINEANSTRECACCGKLTGPTGLAGLSVREWVCSHCGARRPRDRNSAQVIKARGMVQLERCVANSQSTTP